MNHKGPPAAEGLKAARQALKVFQQATGLALAFVPGDSAPVPLLTKAFAAQHGICGLLHVDPQGGRACQAAHQELDLRFRRHPAPCLFQCFAGLTALASPVVVAGKPVATMLGGPVLCNHPTQRQCGSVLARLHRAGIQVNATEFQKLYFQTRVASDPAQLSAAASLLGILATHIVAIAGGCLASPHTADPPCVRRAKHYAQTHLTEPIHTRLAAASVHVSLQHFCRCFRAATGLTFTEYLNRCRVEKAKELLQDTSLRITEAAFAVGFQSIPHFDRIFRRYAGVSPSAYRRQPR